MKWNKTSEVLPERLKDVSYSQVACLVWYRSEVTILVFNHEHQCWDSADFDDHECETMQVDYWMELPEKPEKA